MLIVTNGDSAVASLREALRGSDPNGRAPSFLPWRDVLHEGPVPAGLDPPALAAERARFLATWSQGDEASILRDIRDRDHTLHDALAGEEEVLLWFEHDLYDQLQILQILDRVASQPRSGHLSILCSRNFVAMLDPDEAVRRLPQRVPVTEAQIALARRGWQTFTSTTPEALDRLRQQDLDDLPFLGDAIERLLAELPGDRDGLSCTERYALRTLAMRDASAIDLFRTLQEQEDAPFLGDLSFWRILAALGTGDRPLLRTTDGAPWRMPPQEPASARSHLRRPIQLTDDGRAVLDGRADRCALVSVDRWLGGTHLRFDNLWRWDADRRAVVPPPAG